jgi:hypothetical protein
MDWTTLAAAFLGGGCGGALSASVSVMQLRRDKKQALQARRWADAEIVADAQKLLIDLNPQRRTINANPAPGVEDALWKTLNERQDQLDRQLLSLGNGHPSPKVAAAATELALALVWLAHQSQFAVQALLANRDFLKLVDNAMQRYETADAAASKLAAAVAAAAAPRRHLFGNRPPAEQAPPRSHTLAAG